MSCKFAGTKNGNLMFVEHTILLRRKCEHPTLGNNGPNFSKYIFFEKNICFHMNVVILRYRNCGGEIGKTYIKPSFSSCTCRTTLIQSALDTAMSGASNVRSLDIFGPFRAILRRWKVENFWKKHWKNGILNLNFELPGAWFSKNRQKCLSAVAKSFLRVVWCYNLYQELA